MTRCAKDINIITFAINIQNSGGLCRINNKYYSVFVCKLAYLFNRENTAKYI